MNTACRYLQLLRGTYRHVVQSEFSRMYRYTSFDNCHPSCSIADGNDSSGFQAEAQGADSRKDDGTTKLMPSASFLASLDPDSRKRAEQIMAEVEIMEWMMPHPPAFLEDKQWEKLMAISKREQRVAYLRAYAKHIFHDEQRKAKRKIITDRRNALLDFQRTRINAGAMGYGPTMYELVTCNPERNARRIKHIQGAAQWRTLRLNEKPRIVVDCQFIAKEFDDFSTRLAKQLQIIMEDNFRRREPFDLSIVNYDENNPNLKTVTKTLNAQYTHQTIMPLHTEKDVTDLYNREDIIYIAKWSQQVLRVPLDDKVYVICLGRDNRLPLGAARKRNCRTARIPFNEHFKLYDFSFLPFTSVIQVLHETYQTGGDWRHAILNGISRRYFIPQEENISRTMNTQARLKNEELTQQISEMVNDALQAEYDNK